MKVFYTKTYNISGKNAQKQACIGQVASRMGYEEIALFHFPDASDSDYELDVRMEGIMAAVDPGAVVIFQYPGMVSARYDRCMVKHLKQYPDLKLIIMVQDIGSQMKLPGYPALEEEIELFQQADILILQSPMMEDYLEAHGLGQIPVLYQQLWEYPYGIYNREVMIETRLQRVLDVSIPALIGMKQCGIVYMPGDFYTDMCNPLEAGFCICAGIPMIAHPESTFGRFLLKTQTGFTAGTPEEAEQVVSHLTGGQLVDTKENLLRIQEAAGSGLFTQTLLQNAVYKAFTSSFF